jgi:hypothetical protein
MTPRAQEASRHQDDDDVQTRGRHVDARHRVKNEDGKGGRGGRDRKDDGGSIASRGYWSHRLSLGRATIPTFKARRSLTVLVFQSARYFLFDLLIRPFPERRIPDSLVRPQLARQVRSTSYGCGPDEALRSRRAVNLAVALTRSCRSFHRSPPRKRRADMRWLFRCALLHATMTSLYWSRPGATAFGMAQPERRVPPPSVRSLMRS